MFASPYFNLLGFRDTYKFPDFNNLNMKPKYLAEVQIISNINPVLSKILGVDTQEGLIN